MLPLLLTNPSEGDLQYIDELISESRESERAFLPMNKMPLWRGKRWQASLVPLLSSFCSQFSAPINRQWAGNSEKTSSSLGPLPESQANLCTNPLRKALERGP